LYNNAYEEKFRKGLSNLINENCLKQSALAQKANIRADIFSRIMNKRRRIFADEIARICNAIDKTFEEVMDAADKTGPKEPDK